MASKQHPDGYWSEERIMATANNYQYKEDFRKKEKTAYSIARRLGILAKVTQHMEKRHNRFPDGYWTKERCAEEAQKYKKRIQFQKGCLAAFSCF